MMFDYAWLLFAFPALGALIILFLGPRLPQRVVGWIASAAALAAFGVSALLFFGLNSLPAEERSWSPSPGGSG
jgi:NADH:ubiquinone oxidoreductase subunit 5 (subunit L)/multisubunit Na+/H+ antiporter MnhA subunit